ncbi:MAG: hypothetical protein IPK64_22105 [bacterium]|nr:hypothetical protein [bacterium]
MGARAPLDRATTSFSAVNRFRKRQAGAIVKGIQESGSGEDINLPRSLTSNDLAKRSVMAIKLNRGRPAASRPEPAGYSGSAFRPFDPLAPDARLHVQLDALDAIHEALQALAAEWPGAGESAAVSRPACGAFLLHLDVCRFRRELAALTGACGALARRTRARLDRARPGLETLRGLARKAEEVAHGHH